jgi:hypothetical protein
MTDTINKTNAPHTASTVERVNLALRDYSDKDWNYSRITLVTSDLRTHVGPYTLQIEVLDLTTKQGRTDLKSLSDEVKWGDRHSSELGMLEVISLRLNKALLDITSDDYWEKKRPIVRIAKVEKASPENVTDALWYQLTEVAGEDFDNR